MKKSDNQYDELEVEDAIHGRMVAVSKELEPELQKFLNVVLDKGDDNGKSRIIGNAAEIIVDVLNSEALQNAIASLVSRVIASQQFQTACHKLIKALWDDLIQDPETTAQVVQLLNTAIHNEKINQSFKELIIGLLKDKEIYDELTRLVVLLAEENEVRPFRLHILPSKNFSRIPWLFKHNCASHFSHTILVLIHVIQRRFSMPQDLS